MFDYEGDPNSYPETVDIPDDGEPKPATTVRSAAMALADRTAHLAARRADQIESFTVDNTSDTTIEAHDTVGSGTLAALSGANLTFDDCEVGDLIEITASWLWDTSGGSVLAVAYVRVTEDAGGTPDAIDHDESKRWAKGATVQHSSLHVLHVVATAGQCVVNLMRQGVAGTGGGGSFQDGVDQYVIRRGVKLEAKRHLKGGEIL